MIGPHLVPIAEPFRPSRDVLPTLIEGHVLAGNPQSGINRILQCGVSISSVYASIIKLQHERHDRQKDDDEIRKRLPNYLRCGCGLGCTDLRHRVLRRRHAKSEGNRSRSPALPTGGKLPFQFLAARLAFPARLIRCGLSPFATNLFGRWQIFLPHDPQFGTKRRAYIRLSFVAGETLDPRFLQEALQETHFRAVVRRKYPLHPIGRFERKPTFLLRPSQYAIFVAARQKPGKSVRRGGLRCLTGDCAKNALARARVIVTVLPLL